MNIEEKPKYDPNILILLVVFGGIFGLHRFYFGLHRTGILMFLLAFTGLSIIWLVYDLSMVLSGRFEDSDGDIVYKMKGSAADLKEGLAQISKSELKRTCKSCGHVWHSSAWREAKLGLSAGFGGIDAAFSCCGRQSKFDRAERKGSTLEDLKICSNCGSRSYDEENVVYD
jgi:TM2 domain-containing membrane protein YozV